MVRNLTDNAARFARSAVRLTVRSEDSNALVVVADDGPGIPVASREDVFGRFVRLDEHRSRNDGGVGLGLAIVQEVARLHGGNAVIGESELVALRSSLTLPLAEVSTASRQ